MSDSEKNVTPGVSSTEDTERDVLPVLSTTSMTEHLPKWSKPWYKYRHFQNLYICVAIVTLTATNQGYDSSMLNGLQSLAIWHEDLGNPEGQDLGALTNSVVFGTILSTFYVSNYISDKWGRRIGIVAGQVITLIGAILQGASTNYGFFFASRFILGFGVGVSMVSGPSLIAEISYPTHRYSATAFYNTCWYVGSIIAAWVTYGTRVINNSYSWKVPSYLQGVIPVVQIILIWFVPESPRFYYAKGKVDKAEAMLRKYHIGNSQDAHHEAFLQFELHEIGNALELEKLASNSNYLDFVKIPSYRKRLFLIFFTGSMMQLSGNGLVSYYLNRVLNSINITGEKEQLEINGCLNIFNMVTAMTVASFIGYFKRRHVFICSISGMLCCFIIWTALSAEAAKNDYPKSLSNGVLAFIFLFYMFYNVGLNGMPYLYMTEIMPFTHRAKGMAIFQFVMNTVNLYNGYVNVIALDAIDWKYYIVFDVILAVELAVVYFFYVETSNKTLEEVSAMFEAGDHTLVQPPSMKVQVEHKETV